LDKPDFLFSALKHIRPTVFLGMPAVWDRVRRVLVKTMPQTYMTTLAKETGAQWFQAVQAGMFCYPAGKNLILYQPYQD
jgi:long-subunit acyl-CoA synthetase (AMP-forming)